MKNEASNTIERADFLKQVGVGFGAILFMNHLQGCSSEAIPDPVGPTPSNKIDFNLTISASSNAALMTKGGFIVDKDKKIIIARTLDDNWIAVSSSCTHQGTEIAFRSASTDFKCPLHDSVFSSKGAVITGPASSALKSFNTTFTANTGVLRIFE